MTGGGLEMFKSEMSELPAFTQGPKHRQQVALFGGNFDDCKQNRFSSGLYQHDSLTSFFWIQILRPSTMYQGRAAGLLIPH